MAAEELKDDKLDEAAEEGKAKKKSNIMKIAMIAGGALAFLAINIGVTVMLVGGKQHDAAPTAAGEQKDAGKDAKDGGHGGSADKKEGDGRGSDTGGGKAPVYYAFDPAFVVNFQAQEGLRFLQIKVEVMARDQKVIAAVEQHMPVIRNNLVVLFSSQDFTTISTRVGKERLRTQSLAEIQKVLKENTGQPGIEQVYFTSFVMQ